MTTTGFKSGGGGTGRSQQYQCSFCGKNHDQVSRLIAGPGKVYICDQCVKLCQQIITDENGAAATAAKSKVTIPKTLTPKRIYEQLSEYVIGQEKAKKVLSVAVYNHYKRISSSRDDSSDEVELQKSNIMLIGPTGSGKTLLAQTLAKILDVPFTIADATSLTEAGYVGEDVENILLRLIQAADWDISRAERGIVYIDEIDKIARKGANPSITRDVSGEGVQQGLLKIIEGYTANVPPQGGRKHPHQEFLQIRTHNILFICGGAFEGLDRITASRIGKDKHRIGFHAQVVDKKDVEDTYDTLSQVAPDDLLHFGLIPEFIGRLPLIVALKSLDRNALIQILTEPKNALTKQYQKFFALDKVDLTFTKDALEAAADGALLQKTGARGLRTLLEETLMDVMYEIPSMRDVKKCVVNADTIRNKKRPIMLNSAGLPVEDAKRQNSA